jgi:hypothetical protein
LSRLVILCADCWAIASEPHELVTFLFSFFLSGVAMSQIDDHEASPTIEVSEKLENGRPPLQKLIGIGAIGVTLAIYLLRLDRVVGLFVDDAWYVVLAQSLATGQGYSLPNSPSVNILPLYPPAFPFLLSLIYRIAPSFPDNVYAFKLVSVIAMLLVGILAYRHFQRVRELPWFVAMALTLATALSPLLVFMATSTLMSECFFTLIFLLVIVLTERSAQAGASAKGLQLAALAGTVAAIAFLTRSIGVALLLAGFLYFLKEKLVRSAVVFSVVAVLLVAPWMLYTRAHAPTPAQQKEQGGHIVLPYAQQFWQRRAGFTTSGTVTAADLPERVLNNLTDIAGRDVLRVIAAPLFEALRDPYAEAQSEKVRAGGSGAPVWLSFVLSLLLVAGFIAAVRERLTMAELAVPFSLGITLLWPWETVRFVLPLIPFLVYYFLLGVRTLAGLALKDRAAQWKIVTVIAGLLIAINLYANLNYIAKASSASTLERPQWLLTFDEAEAMFKWTKDNTKAEGVLATANPPLAYLYTGRKTVASDDPAANWDSWNQLGVRYLLKGSLYAEPPDPIESKYKVLYRARRQGNFRVIDLGPPGERSAWGTP